MHFLFVFNKYGSLFLSILIMQTCWFTFPISKSSVTTQLLPNEAPVRGKDIFSYDAKSNGAKDYESLVEEILN